jgi:hypothetical protein
MIRIQGVYQMTKSTDSSCQLVRTKVPIFCEEKLSVASCLILHTINMYVYF